MKIPVQINKIIKITPGKFHSWCESNIGIIKKENKNIQKYLLYNAEDKISVTKEGLNWYQKLYQWLKTIWIYLKKNLKMIKK